jgi:hypothetical protein
VCFDFQFPSEGYFSMQRFPNRIPVYRMHQPTLHSPCLLGEPCAVCRLHASCWYGKACRDCRRGRTPECERALPTAPAFTVRFNQALALVRHGLADFINRQTALRLTFSKIGHLRDQSLRIDERFLLAYVEGDRRARAIIDNPTAGWSARPQAVRMPGEILQKWQDQVQYFG